MSDCKTQRFKSAPLPNRPVNVFTVIDERRSLMVRGLRMSKIEGISKRSVCQRICVGLSMMWLLGLNAHTLHAQDLDNQLFSIGVPTYETELPVESGYIRVASDSLHLEIPLGSFPQRAGRQFKAALVYDSNIWRALSGYVPLYPINVPSTNSGCP